MSGKGSTFTGDLPVKKVPADPVLWRVKWTENRRLELFIRGTLIVFNPYGEQVMTDEQVAEPEFMSVRHHFSVTKEG